MWPDSRKAFLLLEKSVMKQLTLFHSSYLSSYPWSTREGQVISLAASFLWFCAQRRHVGCEGKVLSPCRKAVLWSGVHERKHLWKGTVMSLSPLLLLIWNVITWGLFIWAHRCPPCFFLFFFFKLFLSCSMVTDAVQVQEALCDWELLLQIYVCGVSHLLLAGIYLSESYQSCSCVMLHESIDMCYCLKTIIAIQMCWISVKCFRRW